MKLRSLLILLALIGIMFFLPLWYAQEPAPFVRTVLVERGGLQSTVATNGKVEPVDERELRARLSGRILEIPDPGKHVDKGGVILKIDDTSVRAEIAAAESKKLAAREALRSTKHLLSVIQDRFHLDEKLHREGAVTDEKYEESAAALRNAKAQVTFLEEEVPLRLDSLSIRLEELRAQKASATITAPFDGVVYRSEAKTGELVTAGQPVLWIATLQKLRVRTNIDQVDLGKVGTGQEIRISSNAHPGMSWSGTMTEIIPYVVEKESRAVAEALANLQPPSEGLLPGMTVDVEIVVKRAINVLNVPTNAIFGDRSRPIVYRVEEKQLKAIPVSLGLETINAVEIRDGLNLGDRIVVGPSQGLDDGIRVDVDSGRDEP